MRRYGVPAETSLSQGRSVLKADSAPLTPLSDLCLCYVFASADPTRVLARPEAANEANIGQHRGLIRPFDDASFAPENGGSQITQCPGQTKAVPGRVQAFPHSPEQQAL